MSNPSVYVAFMKEDVPQLVRYTWAEGVTVLHYLKKVGQYHPCRQVFLDNTGVQLQHRDVPRPGAVLRVGPTMKRQK